MHSYLGLDLGTSSLKASVVEAGGRVLARAVAPYRSRIGPGGEAEQDPADWLRALQEAVTACGPAAQDVAAIGLAGQTPTLVVVDDDGEPVRPALTWQDSRAVAEAAALEAALGDPMVHVGTQLPWSASQLPAKLRWLREHEPEAARRGRWVLQPKDYLGLRLTGVPTSDRWSSKGVCDVATGRPARAVLDACGWSPEACPPTDDPTALRGAVTREAARALGLPAGIPVAVGWSDALAAMLAVGAFDRPTAFVLTGTSEIVGVSTTDADVTAAGLYTVPRTAAPLGLVYGPTQSSGAAMEWVATVLGLDVADAISAAGEVEPDGLPVFVPYLNGERAPLWRPDVRGVFMGLGIEHRPAHVARGVMAGVALSARHILELATHAAGIVPEQVHIGGRGATDPTWAAVRAQALGMPQSLHREPHLSALGAAMLGAAAAGHDPTVMARLREEPIHVQPTAADIARADHDFAAYLRASEAALAWSRA